LAYLRGQKLCLGHLQALGGIANAQLWVLGAQILPLLG
jgi:hypothetical protein